jgi:mycothiol synthase
MTAVGPNNVKQRIKTRPFKSGGDYWLVRNLLIETYPITPTGFNWEIRRWDGWRYYNEDPSWNPRWEELVHLWITEDDKLVGAVHPEAGGDAHLELHPDHRYIEEEMIAWAEGHLAVPTEGDGRRLLSIFAFEYDSPRCHLLEKRDYVKTSSWGVNRRLRLGNQPLPQPVLTEGYILRSTRPDGGDDHRVADVLNTGFGRDRHTAKEFATFVRTSPSYRHDLNLVAEAPDGSFASLVGVTYDEANRRGIFEPVCTHPAHRRKGLARALMYEGLRRLRSLGATDIYVESGGDVPPNRLYDSVGFTEAYKGYIWHKML